MILEDDINRINNHKLFILLKFVKLLISYFSIQSHILLSNSSLCTNNDHVCEESVPLILAVVVQVPVDGSYNITLLRVSGLKINTTKTSIIYDEYNARSYFPIN